MFYRTRILLAATFAAGLVTAALPEPSSAFDSIQQKCRATVAKSGAKYAKTVLKTMTKCHQTRDKDGQTVDCNDITAADIKVKVPAAETKFDTTVAGKCTTGTPSDVLYDDCPAPCAAAVPTITTFADVVECEICLTRANTEGVSSEVFGEPTPAPITDEGVAACHKGILKNTSKFYNAVIKNVEKCQKTAEKEGSESITGCTVTDFMTLVNDADLACQSQVAESCQTVTLPSAALDACGGAPSTLFDLTVCACAGPRDSAQELVTQFLALGAGGPTTTTTTLPTGQHAQCPDLGELVLFSKLSNEVCANNGDCTFPRTCDATLLRCTTVAELDTGWNGAGHDSDINDQVTARASLECPGPPSPGCGECEVTGLDPSAGNCRCSNNILTKCDQPFVVDVNDCGAGTCNCFFGSPFPLAAQGTPVCVSNRFSQDITGTANVDLGSGSITAALRAQVFLGHSTDMPCPVCGGKCSNDNSGCIFDSDCDGGATCVHDTPSDGVRNGLCVYDENFHTSNGVACDIDGTNASFPAIIGDATPGQGGGGYSIDCQPEVGKNVSNQGLVIRLAQTTGTATLPSGLDCDGAGVGTDLCPCLVCSGDQTFPCSSNAECGALAGSCAGAPNGGGVTCSANTDCTAANVGHCNNLNVCQKKQSLVCATNADCMNQNVGPCNLQTCTSDGAGDTPEPNYCADNICTDQGGGEGECMAGPSFKYCDGLVKADGQGINSCLNDASCVGGYGTCTLLDPADCFLNPIVATGAPDPQFPVAAATFCVPPTFNTGVNDSAGLPGPGRVVSQGAATTFCASDHNVEYTPGAGGCPP